MIANRTGAGYPLHTVGTYTRARPPPMRGRKSAAGAITISFRGFAADD
jgi:hypothetical protein